VILVFSLKLQVLPKRKPNESKLSLRARASASFGATCEQMHIFFFYVQAGGVRSSRIKIALTHAPIYTLIDRLVPTKDRQ
jgi:hypothetical protein